MTSDLSKNFIQLYKELVDSSPHLAVHNFRCDNSDYSDQLNDSRNAYICFNGYEIQDCYYTYDSRWNKDSADLSFSNKCELCYECVDSDECYSCDFCQDCERCTNCVNCFDCLGCTDCFGCVGLRRKDKCVFNEEYDAAGYAAKLKEAQGMSPDDVRAKIEKLRLKWPHVAMRSRRTDNVFGNYLFDSKDTYYGFKGHDLEDCSYVYESQGLKDCVDCGTQFKSELIYEAIEATDNYNCNFMYWCANCRDCEYIMYCFDCKNCFGCFNLKRKQYCILNEVYEKEEYERLVGEIKAELRERGEYGNFLVDVVLR